MALERTFATLCLRLRALQDALDALGTTVEHDRPERGDVVVADKVYEAVMSVRGELEDTVIAASQAHQAVAHDPDAERARRGLVGCQELFHRVVREFYVDLVAYDRIDDLACIARERGRDWSSWVGVVRDELEQCRGLVEEVRDALFLCWQELVEWVGRASVSVHNTTIGQQIAAPLTQKDGLSAGMT